MIRELSRAWFLSEPHIGRAGIAWQSATVVACSQHPTCSRSHASEMRANRLRQRSGCGIDSRFVKTSIADHESTAGCRRDAKLGQWRDADCGISRSRGDRDIVDTGGAAKDEMHTRSDTFWLQAGQGRAERGE